MDLSRRITLNTMAQIVGRGGVIFLSLLATAILTRSLGQDGYGVFGIINAAVIVFFSLADWGTQIIAVRELAKSPGNISLFWTSCLFLRSLLAILGTFLFCLFVFLNPNFESFRNIALLSGLMIPFLSLKTSARIVFHSKLRLHFAALVEVVSSLLFFGFLIFFSQYLSLQLVIVFLIIAAVSAAVLGLIIIFQLITPRIRLEWSFIKHLLIESLPMGALMVTFSVYNRVGTFILQSLKGEAATGLYVLPFKVHDNLILGAAYLMNSFFPLLSFSPQKGKQEAEQLKIILQKAFDLLLAMAIPMVLIIFFMAPLVIELLGGSYFLPSVAVLRILIFATGIGYLNHLTGYSLVAFGQQKVHLKYALLALIVNIPLNLALIDRYSYLGASAVAVFTETLVFILTFLYLKKFLGFNLRIFSFPKTVWQLITQRGKIF